MKNEINIEDWKEVRLGDLIDYKKGNAFKSKDYKETGVPIVRVSNFTTNSVDMSNCLFLDNDKKDEFIDFELETNDIVIATVGSWENNPNSIVGKVVKIPKEANKSLLNQNAVKIKALNKSDQIFLYYRLKTEDFKSYIIKGAQGSANQASITLKAIFDYSFEFPSIIKRQKIAQILSSLDDKIELNNAINKNLEEIAQILFKQWFVDFEFPNENGEPYKSSGGEMVDSELGEIPKGWRVGTLGEMINIFDSQRRPLSSIEREKRKGNIPYHGATSIMSYVDDYLFDGEYVLMGEDGTVTTKDGYPILQHVWGKFWVNNHAHIFNGKEPYSISYLLCFLKNTNVSHLVTGAVQPKINQGNLMNLKSIIPSDSLILEFTKRVFQKLELTKNNINEIQTLTKLRDELLPKLMSGEVRV